MSEFAYDHFWGSMLVGLVALCVFIFAIVYTVPFFSAPYEHRQCDRFGASTGREVQFRQFSHWSYDCFVRSADGKWVLKSQIRDVSQ